MTLFLAPILMAKRNRLTCFDGMLKQPEVPDQSFLRVNGMIAPGQ
jgi:hypothetical protein